MAENIRIANAQKLLKQKQFFDAYQKFEQALNYDKTNCHIHWGLLLASYQCASENDLVILGVPIADDPNFQKAVHYADAATGVFYKQVAQIVLFSAHMRVYISGCATGYMYLAQKWAAHYKKAASADDPFLPLHDRILNHLEQKAPDATYPGLLMDLYTSCDTVAPRIFQEKCDPYLERMLQTVIEHGRSIIQINYKKYMDKLFDQIVAHYNTSSCYRYPAQYTLEAQWADSCQEYCKAWGVQIALTDLDGYGAKPAERWISLIKRLWEEKPGITKMPPANWERLIEFARSAGASEQADAILQGLLDSISALWRPTKTQYEFLLKHRPSDPQLLWRYVNFVTDNLRTMPKRDQSITDPINHYLNHPSEGTFSMLRKKKNYLNEAIHRLNMKKASLTTDLQQYVDTVIQNAPEKAADYRSQWSAYCAHVDSAYASELAVLEQKQKRLARTIKWKHNIGKFLTVLMGILKLVVGVLGIGIMAQALVLGFKYALDPAAALEYDVLWFYVVTILGSLVGGGLLLSVLHLVHYWGWDAVNNRDRYHDPRPILCAPRSKRISLVFGAFHYIRLTGKRKKAKCELVEPLPLRILNALTPCLIILAALVAAGAFTWSAIQLTEITDPKSTTAQVETVTQTDSYVLTVTPTLQ
jgi:hypothetical protein